MLSDLSYDILTALQNKLEAVWAYDQYIEDCEEAGNEDCRKLFEEMQQRDEQDVELIKAQLEKLVKAGKFS